LSRQGKPADAVAYYRNSIKLRPNFADAYVAQGNALRNLGKLDEAVVCFRKAVKLHPQSAGSWQSLGWLEYQTGNWRASVEALEKSCKLQAGGTGDEYQWIVLALAHARLSGQDGMPQEEREHHKTEGRRWYEQAVKQIDGWGPEGSDVQKVVRAFRAEAAQLLEQAKHGSSPIPAQETAP
jgi:tetratricopeptide (TPR) repeat protein